MCFYQFKHLNEIFHEKQRHTCPNTILFTGSYYFPVKQHIRFPPVSTSASCPHFHKVHRNIFSRHFVGVKMPNQQLIVCCNMIVILVIAILLKVLLVGKECRMCRHESKAETPRPPVLAAVVAHRLVQVVGLHEAYVTVYSLHSGILLERLADDAKDVCPMVEVIRVDDTHHITRRHTNAFVDAVVHPLIFLRYPSHPAPELRLVFLDDVNGVVLRPAVYHEIFEVLILLQQHTLYRVPHSSRTIKCYSNYRNLYCHPLYIFSKQAANRCCPNSFR